jgi:hypothetical protein
MSVSKFFQKIGLVTIDENSEKTNPTPEKKTTGTLPSLTLNNTTVKHSTPTVVMPTITPVQTTNNISQDELSKFVQHFDSLFENANLPGPDYFEFDKMVDAMENVPDNIRYSAAFKALSVQGMTRNTLLTSAGQYIDLINKDKAEFNAAIQQSIGSGIENKKQLIDAENKSIEHKTLQIEQLQREIEASKQSIAQATQEITEHEQKVTVKTATYNYACDKMVEKINSDINQIQTFIQ